MEEIISTIVNNIINSFDFSFCITVNIATYLVIKTITNYKKKGKVSTWNKRLIFLAVSIILAIIYYLTGSEVKTILNSFILAPVSWSWIFKPICDKCNIGYNTKDGVLTSVLLDNKKEVKTSGVFLSIGSTPNSEMFDVDKDNGYIITSNNYETNISNVYAIGDVIKKDYYQLINASYEGMIAALDIINKEKNN